MKDQVYNRLRLGLNVRRMRHGMRLTQAQLASVLKCSSKTVSDIELGKRDISANMLFDLCRALNCPVQELLLGV